MSNQNSYIDSQETIRILQNGRSLIRATNTNQDTDKLLEFYTSSDRIQYDLSWNYIYENIYQVQHKNLRLLTEKKIDEPYKRIILNVLTEKVKDTTYQFEIESQIEAQQEAEMESQVEKISKYNIDDTITKDQKIDLFITELNSNRSIRFKRYDDLCLTDNLFKILNIYNDGITNCDYINYGIIYNGTNIMITTALETLYICEYFNKKRNELKGVYYIYYNHYLVYKFGQNGSNNKEIPNEKLLLIMKIMGDTLTLEEALQCIQLIMNNDEYSNFLQSIIMRYDNNILSDRVLEFTLSGKVSRDKITNVILTICYICKKLKKYSIDDIKKLYRDKTNDEFNIQTDVLEFFKIIDNNYESIQKKLFDDPQYILNNVIFKTKDLDNQSYPIYSTVFTEILLSIHKECDKN